MEEKKTTARPCVCGDRNPIIAKIKAGLYVVACGKCPTHSRGSTEAEALKNWNLEVSPDAGSGKRN